MKVSLSSSFLHTSGGKVLFIALLFLLSCAKSEDYTESLEITLFPDRTRDFSLWQLEPFYDEVQMSYILKTDDSNIAVVDGGGVASGHILESYLMQLGGEVDTWVLSHPHSDHVGALMEIIKSGRVKIGRILYVSLNETWVKTNEPNVYDLGVQFNALLQTAQAEKVAVEVGEVFELGAGVEMRVLGAFNEAITSNAVNNSSLVFSVRSDSKSVLFLGDLGIAGGDLLLSNTNPEEIKADYVQMAHHGQHGVDRAFYEAVDAKYALWPTPKWLWENRADGKGYNSGNFKTFVVRQWMEELGIKRNYVSGLEGTVQID